MVLIFVLVRRRTGSLFASVMGVFLYAAAFRISGAWYDVARIDSLLVLMTLAAFYTYESASVKVRSYLCPVFVALQFFTKQSGVVLSLALIVGVLLSWRERSWRERLVFSVMTTGLILAGCLALNVGTGGWWYYYVFGFPSKHVVIYSMFFDFWSADIWARLGPVLCCAVAGILLSWGKGRAPDQTLRDACVLGGVLGVSYLSRLHSGGYENVLMPAYAGIVLYGCIGLSKILNVLADRPAFQVAILAAALVQFFALSYWPWDQVPSTGDLRQGQRLIYVMQSFKGEVACFMHPWYSRLAGKSVPISEPATADFFRTADQIPKSKMLQEEIIEEFHEAAVHEKYDALVFDSESCNFMCKDFDAHYRLAQRGLSGDALHELTGMDTRPDCLYVRRSLKDWKEP